MNQVAVVIPTYNRAHQIADTIRSVLCQSLPPAEVVVVDDGSTDDTEAVVAPFGSQVRYVRQANGGVSVARNHGVKLTSSPLVAFVDSDDIWLRDKLAIQVAALGVEPAAEWSITGCDVIDLNGKVIPSRRGFTAVFGVFGMEATPPPVFFQRYFRPVTVELSGALHPGWTGDAWLPLFLGNFALPSSALIRRDAFDRTGGFDPAFRLAEETEFFHRLAATAPVVIMEESLVGYRVGQAGSLISPANTAKLIANALTSLERAATSRAGDAASNDHLRRGRQALYRKLAYLRLSQREGAGARAALSAGWRSGVPRDAASLGIYAASYLPAAALGVLQRVKGAVRR
jgi:glycosyltransferase involved in cell wall biosynthesis